MQKKIIALAIAAAFAAPVSAMAAAELYGSIDGGLRHQSQDKGATAKDSETGLTSGNYNSNRWGIKASDDLGDGMKANVVLEGSLNIADGTVGSSGASAVVAQVFDRQATVGVSAGWGKLDVGRQNAISFKTAVALNPFGSNYIGLGYNTMATNGTVRVDRLASYTGTFFDALTVMVEHGFDNAVVSNTATAAGATNTTTFATTGARQAVGVSYKLGDLVIAGSHTSVEANPAPTLPIVGDAGDSTNMILGANYTMGDIKVFVATASTEVKGTALQTNQESNVTWVGASYKMSDKIGLTAAYYMGSNEAIVAVGNPVVENTSDRLMIGATYALGKATKLYAGFDTQTNNTGAVAAPDLKTQGLSLGLATAF